MLDWFSSLFAWHAVRNCGVWVYEENAVSGRRRATRVSRCGSPLDHAFMRDGDVVRDLRGTYVIGSQAEIWIGASGRASTATRPPPPGSIYRGRRS